MLDICCVGHITSDKVITPKAELYMPGGTAFYFSYALSKIDTQYLLVTSLAESEMHYVDDLKDLGIDVRVQLGRHTVYFENIYGENQDEREQNVLQKADAFTMEQLLAVEAKIFHLGPLLADDFSTGLVKALADKGKVSLDVQGYLRKVVNKKVYPVDWPEKKTALQYVHTVKADVAELIALTGIKEVSKGAALLQNWGVKEVVITNGSKGSSIYCEGQCDSIPAYLPKNIVDATGCGDTYIAGYLYRRLRGDDFDTAGRFAAAIASLKMESPGPFDGTEEDVTDFLTNYR